MAVRKLSISIPAELAEAATAAALREGSAVSAWLARAVQEKLRADEQHDEGRRAAVELVAEYEAEHGPISAAAYSWADAVIAGAQLVPDPARTPPPSRAAG